MPKTFSQFKEEQQPFENDINHVVGNAIFAIETNLLSLDRRCKNVPEGPEIIQDIRTSIEKIKAFLEKTK